jgi:hypothetical protein
MGYMHIDNLYKDQRILMFKECFAMEKIHGTSAHVAWRDGKVAFFSGGEKRENFLALFDADALAVQFAERFGERNVTFYGEAYGGKQQGMSATYGKALKFIVFDVKIGEQFVDVPVAHEIAKACGFEFVHYDRVACEVGILDFLRDTPSFAATNNGCAGTDRFGCTPPIREGVVLRPIHECTFNDGKRVIAKHKRPEFSERKTAVPVDDEQRQVLEDAQSVADEWVVAMRMQHVLDKLGNPTEMSATGKVIEAMVENVMREANGEVSDTHAVRKAIGKAAATMYKAHVTCAGRWSE